VVIAQISNILVVFVLLLLVGSTSSFFFINDDYLSYFLSFFQVNNFLVALQMKTLLGFAIIGQPTLGSRVTICQW